MKTTRISAALVVTIAMFAAGSAYADVPTATGGSQPTTGGTTVVLNTYSKVWVSGDNRGPQKIGKDTGAGLIDANFGWDDQSYATDKSKVNLITTYTRSNDTANNNNSYMQGGFAVATLTAAGVVPVGEFDLPNLNGNRTWMRPQAQFISGNRVLLIAASEDNGVNNNPQPVAFVADATTGKILGIPNNTRGANNLNKPTNLIQQGLKDGLTINNPNDQRGPHTMVRTTGDTFVLGMQYNNQAVEGFSVTVNPDNSIKMNWLQRYSNNAQHCRPQVQIDPANPGTGYIAAVEANTQPADIGFRVSQFNIATGKPTNSKIVIKSDPNNNKYVSEPVMGIAGDKLAITFGLSSKARNKGNNDDGHAGGRQVDNAVMVDMATLTAVGTPVIGMGQYGRHGSAYVTNYGEAETPTLAVISGSSTGTGGGFIQMVPINSDGTFGAKDAAKVYTVSPFSDVANVQTRGKNNPNNQGRGFINGMGGVPNPGYTTDATQAQKNFMPEVKSFSLSAVTGYSGADAMGLGLKNSIWMSLVPASWQPGLTTIPGTATATPGTNADGTGPSPRTTTTDTGSGSTDVVPNGADDATHPNEKTRAYDTSDSSGCNATGSTSSGYGVIGLAVMGVLVALRRKNEKKNEKKTA